MIGILGGTFDPIHYGHLRPALEVMQHLSLRQLRFLPLNLAVHRQQPIASARQRLDMVRAAIATQPGFVCDDREIRRDGPSYSVDSLTELRRELGDSPLCLLVGSDAFEGFLDWHRPHAILDLAHLVVMQRPGARPSRNGRLRALAATRGSSDAAALKARPAGHLWFQDVTQLGISATAIRTLVASGRNPRFLLPEPVLAYIDAEALYRRG